MRFCWWLLAGLVVGLGTVPAQAQAVVEQSIVEGGYASGTGVITDAPGFADPAAGNYQLTDGSPALDAGAASALPADALDLDGDGDTGEPLPIDLGGTDRVVDNDDDGDSPARPDLGAWEAPPGVQLPVELTAWTVRADEGHAVLAWTTASETNNAGFRVEHRPAAAEAFQQLAFVEGAGTTTRARSYRHRTEAALTPGAHVFRLVQVDVDGTEHPAPEVELLVGGLPTLRLLPPHPNPARRAAQMRVQVPRSGPVTVAAYDVLGRRVATLYDGPLAAGVARPLRIDTTAWPSGIYFIRARHATGTATQRLVVTR